MLTCANHAVEVGLENLAGAVDQSWIKRTSIHAADPGVVDQQRHVAATACRRAHRCGIRYVHLDRHNAWQVDSIWVSYASVDLFRITPEQLSGKSQAETAIGPSDEGN